MHLDMHEHRVAGSMPRKAGGGLSLGGCARLVGVLRLRCSSLNGHAFIFSKSRPSRQSPFSVLGLFMLVGAPAFRARGFGFRASGLDVPDMRIVMIGCPLCRDACELGVRLMNQKASPFTAPNPIMSQPARQQGCGINEISDSSSDTNAAIQ